MQHEDQRIESVSRFFYESAKLLGLLVDLIGIEPMTSSMPWKRAPSCATGPQREEHPLFCWSMSNTSNAPHGTTAPPPSSIMGERMSCPPHSAQLALLTLLFISGSGAASA